MKLAIVAVAIASSLLVVSSSEVKAKRSHAVNKGFALNKVMDLLVKLQSKIENENKRQSEMNEHHLGWCAETKVETDNSLKVALSRKEKAEAVIGRAEADIAECDEKIGTLVSSMSGNSGDLTSATETRKKEEGEFETAQAELLSSIKVLSEAVSIIGTEMKKNPAALVQIDKSVLDKVLAALSSVMDAATLPSDDKAQLTSLIQAAQGDSDDAAGAPAGAVYKSSSGGVLEILENMKEKAETDLDGLQKTEKTAKHNFQMLKVQLTATIAADSKELDHHKAKKTSSEEAKATAEGELNEANLDLEQLSHYQVDLIQDCNSWKNDYSKFEADQAAELEALTQAKSAITTAIGSVGAAAASADIQVSSEDDEEDSSISLVQVDSTNSGSMKVVEMIKKLARERQSKELSQLASRIRTVIRYSSSGGDDTFGKVKDLIKGMIEKLTAQIAKETTDFEACEKAKQESEDSLGDLEAEINEIDAAYGTASSKVNQNTKDLHTTQGEISSEAKRIATLKEMFDKETEEYNKASKEMKEGLAAVRRAISTLRDFYDVPAPAPKPLDMQPISQPAFTLLQEKTSSGASNQRTLDRQTAQVSMSTGRTNHKALARQTLKEKMSQPDYIPALQAKKSTSSANGIIEILSTIEDDLASSLSELSSQYQDAERNYNKENADYNVERVRRANSVKYFGQYVNKYTKESLEKKSELQGKKEEEQAVQESYEKIKEDCTTLPETYAAKKAGRDAEIAGLKEALAYLDDETVFVQHHTRGLRGFRRHDAY